MQGTTHSGTASSFERLTKRKISLCLRIDEEKLLTLRKISLAGQGIKGLLEDSIELPNLRELDLSYNRLDEFPNWRMIVHVKRMNVSFNDIRSIKMKEKLSALEELDISWNSLTKCRKSLETLKTFAPSLKTLNLERNPFSDIVQRDKIVLLTGIYFPSRTEVRNLGSLDPKVFGLKVARNTLAELYDRHPTISISHSPIGRVHLKKPSVHLVRLHLIDNCITDLDGLTQEHFPKLKYLDLTNNLITSLRPMGSYNTIVEFYCAHNDIRRLQEIENLKSWQKLQVVDLSYNPDESAISYKNFLIFHLVDLKVAFRYDSFTFYRRVTSSREIYASRLSSAVRFRAMGGEVEYRGSEKRPWKYIGSDDVADDESCPEIDERQTVGRRQVFHQKGRFQR